MIDSRRVSVARYILQSDYHFRKAAEAVGTPDYEPHLQAALIASRAATDELVAGAEDEDTERRLARYVGP